MTWRAGISLGTTLLVMACSAGSPSPDAPPPVAPSAAGPATPPAPPDASLAIAVVDPVAAGATAEGITALCDDNLALARRLVDEIKRVPLEDPEKLTWEATLGRLDDAFLAISNGGDYPYLAGVVHPDDGMREAARACESKVDELATSIYLDADLARAIKAFADKGEELTEERQRFLERTLRELRRNGIDLPAKQQARLREINRELTDLGQQFIAEIGATQAGIRVAPQQLAGLPEAFKNSHPPGDDGKVEISTDYPDYFPFVTYAEDRNAARDLYIAYTNRGGKANVERLHRILALRNEKARMLGYDTWADYAIEPRMAKNPLAVAGFLERVQKAIAPAVKRELAQFRAEYLKAVKDPRRPMIPPDRYFLTDRVKSKHHQLDSRELAEYFEVEAVTRGLLELTAEMYGLEYVARPDAPTWHPAVKAYDVVSEGKPIARFYLDLAPRPNKYKHAAMFGIRSGKTLANGERQTPMAALVCNFPPPGEPMPHDQVVTYFHEFGHVLHHMLTETELASFAGANTVRDFVEAPSQMFEEWAWSPEVLARFARHRESGEPIPTKLVGAMNRARKVGLALATERQLFLARLDLGYHTAEPPVDSTALLRRIHRDTFSFEFVDGTHFQSSFGHLMGYDAGYYGYQWALSLAHDVLTRFKQDGLLNPETARAWREKVLARGGSRDERAMLRDFLGRDPSERAYADFLSE